MKMDSATIKDSNRASLTVTTYQSSICFYIFEFIYTLSNMLLCPAGFGIWLVVKASHYKSREVNSSFTPDSC